MSRHNNVHKNLKFSNIYKIAIAGILSAQALVLSLVESLIVIPGLPPGVKLGLSNIVVMFSMEELGFVPSFMIVVVKSCFAGITRGLMSFILSFTGGVFSILIMYLLLKLDRNKTGILGISISGAVMHNLSQLLVISFVIDFNALIYYSPILIISGIAMGLLTGTIYKFALPLLSKLGLHLKFGLNKK